MRIFLSADIEGVAGIAHYPSTGPGRFDYEAGRRWMTQEVAAACRAAIAVGAQEIVVTDGHGSAHNLLFDDLPDGVRLVRSWPRPLIQMQGIEDGRYDAAIFVGHHASASMWGGILSHTFVLAFRDVRLNGVSQSETTLNALVAAHHGVPVVFSSGDDAYIAHCRERLPQIETVVTKRSLGLTAIDSLKPAAAQRLIAEGVTRALGRIRSFEPLPLPERFELEIEFADRSQPEMWEWLPWCERTGPFSVRWVVRDIVQVMKVIGFASFYQSHGVPRYGEGKP
ncbi:MAG: M55 family metallopeptidase [Pseudomonadota bacterium]|jgi:D-amino peptidase|nr:M55 family metallopeptidase [Rubrivivax sp.]MCA3257978.1 M55 family metallopeptidase [Rubrivivax sp.]MCE2911405.1 M55 family metallopeptidase [Rubrivivax sp.]MCZ8032319.1 M55 family metallopeptidase [Rubrivivax sp.]